MPPATTPLAPGLVGDENRRAKLCPGNSRRRMMEPSHYPLASTEAGCHYVDKHRPAVAAQIVGWETIDHPTEGELVKMARQFFVKRGEMAATPRLV